MNATAVILFLRLSASSPTNETNQPAPSELWPIAKRDRPSCQITSTDCDGGSTKPLGFRTKIRWR